MTEDDIRAASRLIEKKAGMKRIAHTLTSATEIENLDQVMVSYPSKGVYADTGAAGRPESVSIGSVFRDLGLSIDEANRELLDCLRSAAITRLGEIDVELDHLGVKVASDG